MGGKKDDKDYTDKISRPFFQVLFCSNAIIPLRPLLLSVKFNHERLIQELFCASALAPSPPIWLKDKENAESFIQEAFCASAFIPSVPILFLRKSNCKSFIQEAFCASALAPSSSIFFLQRSRTLRLSKSFNQKWKTFCVYFLMPELKCLCTFQLHLKFLKTYLLHLCKDLLVHSSSQQKELYSQAGFLLYFQFDSSGFKQARPKYPMASSIGFLRDQNAKVFFSFFNLLNSEN